MDTIWYVVVSSEGKDRTAGYPLNIYADKGLAELVAKANGEKVVAVTPVKT